MFYVSGDYLLGNQKPPRRNRYSRKLELVQSRPQSSRATKSLNNQVACFLETSSVLFCSSLVFGVTSLLCLLSCFTFSSFPLPFHSAFHSAHIIFSKPKQKQRQQHSLKIKQTGRSTPAFHFLWRCRKAPYSPGFCCQCHHSY